MKIGFFIFNADEGEAGLECADAVQVAIAGERLGYHRMFVPDHSHVPVESKTDYPEGYDLPRQYYRMHDPIATCGAIAAVTKRIQFGPGVCLVIQRDPIHLAKSVATLDHLSNGRFVLGVGAGWAREEMQNHGTDPRTRMRLMTERMAAMKEIWTKEKAEFHGEFVDFDPIYCWPKPVQTPHPPIVVGGDGPTVLDRVIAFGDEWMPSHPADQDIEPFRPRIAELKERAKAAGRTIPVSVINGGPEFIEPYAEMGVEECILPLPVGPTAVTIAELERLAPLIEKYKDL